MDCVDSARSSLLRAFFSDFPCVASAFWTVHATAFVFSAIQPRKVTPPTDKQVPIVILTVFFKIPVSSSPNIKLAPPTPKANVPTADGVGPLNQCAILHNTDSQGAFPPPPGEASSAFCAIVNPA